MRNSVLKTFMALLLLLSAGPAFGGADQWTGGGPLGSRNSLFVLTHPAAPGTIWLSPDLAPLRRSLDGGQTWQVIGAGMPSDVRFRAIAVSPTNPQILLATYWDNVQAWVFRSIDGGTNWTDVTTPELAIYAPNVFAFHPTNGSIVYMGDYFGDFFKSTDGGSTWAHVPTASTGPSYRRLVVDPNNPSVLWLGSTSQSNRRVLKSVDGGNTFAPANSGLPAANIGMLFVDSATGRVFAGPGVNGLWVTSNGGASWAPIGTGIPPNVGIGSMIRIPGTPSRLFVSTGAGVFVSSDEAATWTPASASLNQQVTRMLARDWANPGLFVATGRGLEHSADGVTFGQVTAATADLFPQFWSIAPDASSPSAFYGGSPHGVYRTLDGGSTWTLLVNGLVNHGVNAVTTFPTSPETVLAATVAGLFRSTDSGANWAPTGTGLPAGNVFRISPDPSDPTIAWAPCGGNGVYRSTDGGLSFEAKNNGLSLPGTGPVELSVSASNPDVVFGTTQSTGLLIRTTDGGANWTTFDLGFYFDCVAVDAFDPMTVMVGRGDGLSRSVDGGATFADITPPEFTEPYVNEIYFDPFTPGRLYVATDGGAFESLDGGSTWADLSAGFPASLNIQSFAVSTGGTRTLVAGCVVEGGGYIFQVAPLENQAGNSDFVSGTAGWQETGEAIASWSALDAGGSPSSGSILVTNQGGTVATRRRPLPSSTGDGVETNCQPVFPEGDYAVSGMIRFPSGQAADGTARVTVTWYSDAGCGNPVGSTQTPAIGSSLGHSPDTWLSSSLAAITAPANAIRARLGLTVTKQQPIGTYGSLFDEIELRLLCSHPDATITSSPPTICAGNPATIEVALTGIPPWTVTWTDAHVDAGVTQAVLRRTVTPGAPTSYDIDQVTDATCTRFVTQDPLLVDIGGTAPADPAPAANGPLCEGDTLELAAVDDPGVDSWEWYGPAGFFSDQRAPSIPGATPELSGEFTVLAHSGSCVRAASIDVVVVPRPRSAVSGGGTFCVGSSTTIQAVLSGTPPWNLTWSDGFVQNGVTSGTASRSVTPPVGYTSYQVTALSDSSCGGTSQGAALTLGRPSSPTFNAQPSDQTICDGEPATFTVTTVEATDWTWLRNGSPIAGANSATLTLSAAGGGDVGWYTCVAFNSCGSSFSDNAWLDVVPGPPSSPGDALRLGHAGGGGVALSWDPVAEATQYRIHRCDATISPCAPQLTATSTTESWQDSAPPAGDLLWYAVEAANLCGSTP